MFMISISGMKRKDWPAIPGIQNLPCWDDYRGLNANMHTVMLFGSRRCRPGTKKYHIRAGRIIDHVIRWAEDNSWRIPEHFTKEWVADLDCNRDRPDDPFKPYGATPGHGIEWAS